jgi:hypothetical protein
MVWNRILQTAFLTTLAFNVSAQHLLPVQMDTNVYQYEVIASGVADYFGTSLTNEFTRKVIYGGDLSSDEKNRAFAQHRENNIFGMDLSSEIEFRNYTANMFKREDIGYVIRIGALSYMSTSYSKDAFGMIFYGNDFYKENTANFSGTSFNSMFMQKIGFGLVNKKTKSSLTINYYNLSNFLDFYLRDGVYSSNDAGDSLMLSLDGSMSRTTGNNFSKGWGVGIDGDFRIPVSWTKERTAYFQVSFKNFGFMRANNVDRYFVDSTYNYSGTSFNNLINNSSGYSNENAILDSMGVTRTNSSIGTLLPGLLQVGKLVSEDESLKLQSYFGIRLYTALSYNPLVYAGGQYQFKPWGKVAVHGTYGGFGRFRFGMYSQFDFEKIHIGIGSEDLVGAFYNQAKGESIYLRLAYRW